MVIWWLVVLQAKLPGHSLRRREGERFVERENRFTTNANKTDSQEMITPIPHQRRHVGKQSVVGVYAVRGWKLFTFIRTNYSSFITCQLPFVWTAVESSIKTRIVAASVLECI
jgi:hypothetical protein